MDEELKQKAQEVVDALFGDLKGKKVHLVQPQGKCEVCGTMQDEDLVYMGPGVAGLAYGCGHTAHFKQGMKARWVDKDDNLVLEV